jgi:multidrug efflux pump subunit AcrA (membrane-fusion protein)
MEQKIKNKHAKTRLTIILISVIVVMGVFTAFKLISMFFPGGPAAEDTRVPGARTPAGGTAVRVQNVARGTIENTVLLSGDVLSASQVSIYPSMAGKLIALNVKAGDRVGRGAVVAMIDPSRPGDNFFANPVTATVSGAVLSVPVNVGDTLQTNQVICVIGDLSALRIETHVSERYTVFMKRGIPAQISFEAIDGETFAAEVDEVSPVLDPASRTMRIQLRLLPDSTGRVDPRILAGMYATVSLVTNSRTGVPVVPRSALINTYGKWIVYVVPPGANEASLREVEIGLESEDLVEITKGLDTEDRLVVAGQNFLSDGDTVRIVE